MAFACDMNRTGQNRQKRLKSPKQHIKKMEQKDTTDKRELKSSKQDLQRLEPKMPWIVKVKDEAKSRINILSCFALFRVILYFVLLRRVLAVLSLSLSWLILVFVLVCLVFVFVLSLSCLVVLSLSCLVVLSCLTFVLNMYLSACCLYVCRYCRYRCPASKRRA